MKCRQVDMLLMQKSMTVSARMEEPEEAIFLQVHWGCQSLEGDFRDVRLQIDESQKMQPNLLYSPAGKATSSLIPLRLIPERHEYPPRLSRHFRSVGLDL